MSEERVVHRADLGKIERNLYSLDSKIAVVASQVSQVDNNVREVQNYVQNITNEINSFREQFNDYVKKDVMHKQLQLAETKIIKVRQKLKDDFGYYSEIRRRVTGILQAVDVSLVKKETIENVTEELMLSAPGYWLAPSLIALSAWINDNQDIANKAVKESLRRDTVKTCLFFSLVARRASRLNASKLWLNKYLSGQDPKKLDREAVIVINAYANGIFGIDSKGECTKTFEKWIEELSETVGFVENQQKQWEAALISKKPNIDDEGYQYLPKYSESWDLLKNALSNAKLNKKVLEHFNSIFDGEIIKSNRLENEVDNLLDNLVTNFDDEELPLREEELLLQLIIDDDGNKESAKQKFELEKKALSEKIDFTQLLTNAAMHPELSHATKCTQRLAVSLSKDWIEMAYDDLVAKNRANSPVDIKINIEGWEGITVDGKNESELLDLLNIHMENKKEEALKGIKLNVFNYFTGIAGGIAALHGAVTLNLIESLLGVGGILWFLASKKSLEKKRKNTKEHFENLIVKCREILKATLAEIVDWKNQYNEEDRVSEEVKGMLSSIKAEQHISGKYDKGRAIVNK